MNDKHFWAAFLNLARHNAYITINHINQQLGIKPIESDENVSSVQSTWMADDISTRLEKKGKLHNLILKHFPFLASVSYGEQSFEVFKNIHTNSNGKKRNKTTQEKQTEQTDALSFESITGMLFTFLDALHQLRNYYSHYEHPNQKEKPIFQDHFFHRLYNVFEASVRLVKEDHKHNPKIDPHTDFKHLIRKNKNGDNPDFKHRFVKDGAYTEAGLLFFVSLFLDKKDAIWMQKKIYGFKGRDKGYMRMTNEVFCRSRMLIPKLRLESVYDNDQMLLDILNELTRCPKPLYDRLKEEDRETFRVTMEDYLTDEADNEDPFKSTLIRHENRYPYFALRYFDLKKIFSNLRFQIDLGTYHFSIYDKKIGEQTEKRHLTRNLYGFDRIQFFNEANQPEGWRKLVKDLDYYETSDLPFISKTTPHYHLCENKIGIKFKNPDFQGKWPDLTVEDKNGKKKYTYSPDFVADAFLSVHELTPMMFYYLLTQDGAKVEGVIQGILKNIFDIYDYFEKGAINSIPDLEEKLVGKNILIGHLPKQMISILSNNAKDMEKEALRKQNELLNETQKRIEQIERQEKEKIRIGKRRSGLMKPGVIADWLVKDMMRFQPVAYDSAGNPLNRSKANSTEYQLLQYTFALYGSEKHRLPHYFKQLNLIGNQNPHPFLSSFDWEKQPNILSFYSAYLKARLSFIKNINPGEWKKLQYFLLLKEPKNNRKTLVAGWKNGFNLPRGIFTEPIREWLKKGNKYSAIYEAVKEFEKPGFITKTIPLYFREIEKDDVPAYYNYEVNIANPDKPKEGKFLSVEDRVYYQSDNKEILNQGNTLLRIEYINEDFQLIGNKKIGWNKKRVELKNLFTDFGIFESFKNQLNKQRIDLAQLNKEAAQVITKEYLDHKAWQKFEKQLRLLKSQDMLLWLICKQMKMKELVIDELKLKNVNVLEGFILARGMSMTLPVTIYPANEKGIVNRKSEPINTFYVEEKNTKVRKQGNFKALIKDRRLNGLFSYANAAGLNTREYPISKTRLEHELLKYQTARVDIFKIMLEIEKTLTQAHPDLPKDNFRAMMEKWLAKQEPKNGLANKVNALVAIRNAFAHNQYPMYNKEYFGTDILFCPVQLQAEWANPKDDRISGMGVAAKLVEITNKLSTSIL